MSDTSNKFNGFTVFWQSAVAYFLAGIIWGIVILNYPNNELVTNLAFLGLFLISIVCEALIAVLNKVSSKDSSNSDIALLLTFMLLGTFVVTWNVALVFIMILFVVVSWFLNSLSEKSKST